MPEETIELTQRALHRLKVIEAVTARRLTQAEAGGQWGLTTRQMQRLVVAYRAEGAAGLVSRRLGQPSNRRLKEPWREVIRALLVERYPDFGPTLAQEKLYELIQIDGSPHDGFEGRGPRCTLIVFIDDATGRLLQR